MKEIGCVLKEIEYKRYYLISSEQGELVTLFFEELRGPKLRIGDIIEYDDFCSKEYGKCALNPISLYNKYLDELKSKFETKESIIGFIYKRNEGGYEVSYNGYKCFLPNAECNYRFISENEDTLLYSNQRFVVLNILGKDVILSRKEILKGEFPILSEEEIKELFPGFSYLGKVKSVKGYGVFISYKFTDGFLHISKIINEYDSNLSKSDRIEFEKLLSEVFNKGREVFVHIDSINNIQYSLNWDKNIEPNKEICFELKERGLSV